MTKTQIARLSTLLLVALSLLTWNGFRANHNTGLALAAGTVTLQGTGATFPAPLYQKWFAEYNKLHSNVQINYQALGSGAGIKQFQQGLVDFGASDAAMTDEEMSQVRNGGVILLPMTAGSVALAYNLPGGPSELKLSREAYVGIFLGKITNWNDGAIAKANPDLKFPNQAITVVHRSDGSGTSYIWTDYLSKVSSDWANATGKGTSVKWPVGVGGKGNEGVAGMIRSLPGSLGYIELIYALQNKINYGSVRNKSGTFVKASLESTTAAAQGVKMPADFRVSITNAMD